MSNKMKHYLITNTETGEAYVDKCRDTPGGYHNLVNRLLDRAGATILDSTFVATGDGATLTIDATGLVYKIETTRVA